MEAKSNQLGKITLMALGILMALGSSVTSAASPPHQKGDNQTLIQQDLMRLPETPETGDQITAIKDAVDMKGKVLKVEADGVYLIEPLPGRKVRVRVNDHTKMPQNFLPMPGDWIQAQVTPDLYARMMQRSAPAYTMEGDLLDVEGNLFVLVDASGKEVSLRLSPETKITGLTKPGDWVRVEFTPDRKALSLAPATTMRGVGGG